MTSSRRSVLSVLVAVIGLALALGGCLTSQPSPDRQRSTSDSVLVDAGVVNGVEWSVDVFREDAQICSAVTIGDRERHRLSCSDLPPGPVNFRSAWFAGEVPLLLFRLVEPNVAAVRLLVGEEGVIVPTISLAPLDIHLRAVAIEFPTGARVDGMVYLASDGTELTRDANAVRVPGDVEGDGVVTFVDGDSVINVGEYCRLGTSACNVQVGPDR